MNSIYSGYDIVDVNQPEKGYVCRYKGERINTIIVDDLYNKIKYCPVCNIRLLPLKYEISKPPSLYLYGRKCWKCGLDIFGKREYSSQSDYFNKIQYRTVTKRYFKGYTCEVENQIIVYKSIYNDPLDAHIYSSNTDICECGRYLSELKYFYNTVNRKLYIAGKKCSICGKNYFVERDILGKEYAFNIINKRTFIESEDEKKSPQKICSNTILSEKKIENLLPQESKIQEPKHQLEFDNSNEVNIKKIKKHSPIIHHMSEGAICCICDLVDKNTMMKIRVTINSVNVDDSKDIKNRICSTKSIFGTACLKAVANDIKTFTVLKHEYKITKSIVYNMEIVNSYKENVIVKETKQKKGENDKTRNRAKKQISILNVIDQIQDVYVYYNLNNCNCIKKKHDIETVTMKTHSILDTSEICVNVFHCSECNKYFINNDAIKDLLIKKIVPSFKFHVENEMMGKLNPESKLKMYGYSVQENGLTEQQRKKLLSVLIDKELMTKQEIINCIEFNVNFVGKKANMKHANEKWRKDIEFVSQYIKGNSKVIKGRLRK